ncbi:MAG: hypothetical protein ABGZ35_29965 [Planctomycetaceae bacterium]
MVVINFFVFSFIVRYSALGTLPDQQGFVVRERADVVAVTESIWLLNLSYSCISWLSPLFMMTYAIVWQNDLLGPFSLHRPNDGMKRRGQMTDGMFGRWCFYVIAGITIPLGMFSLTSKLVTSLLSWCSM